MGKQELPALACLQHSGFRLGFVALVGLAAAQPTNAKEFKNQYITFELPLGWECNLEGSDWVCQRTDPATRRDSIIVMTAKLQGEQDSLPQYLAYLKKPRVWTGLDGGTVTSKVLYARLRTINGVEYVDAQHEESELPGFVTRYLATVRSDIAVLVTYSVRRDRLGSTGSELDEMLRTVKVARRRR